VARELESESARLKELLAEAELDKAMLKDLAEGILDRGLLAPPPGQNLHDENERRRPAGESLTQTFPDHPGIRGVSCTGPITCQRPLVTR
jgi:hypothetical protein